MESIFGLLLLLVGMTWIFASLLFGPKAGKHLFKTILMPFGCIFKLCLVILILCIGGVFLTNMIPRVKPRDGHVNSRQVDSTNQNIQEPSSLFWPLPETFHKINQRFGEIWSYNSSKRHTGIDIKAPKNAEVYAAKDGILSTSISLMDGSEAKKSWGYCIVLAHDNNTWTTSYLHIKPNPDLQMGSHVAAHDLLGWVYFDHLHFGIRKHSFNTLSMRGALPITSDPSGDPAFPEQFADPKDFTYQIRR